MSLKALMDEVVEVERTIWPAYQDGVSPLRVYRWEPVMYPEMPAVWNWLLDSPGRKPAVDQFVDEITLAIRIGIAPSDDDQEMSHIETYVDAAVPIIDRALNERGGPLDGVGAKGWRQSLRTIQIRFGDSPAFCIELPIRVELWRDDTPT